MDLSRKAKFITSISLGDTKLNYAHSSDREHNGKLIAPEGLETINQGYGRFSGSPELSPSPDPEAVRENFLK